MCIDPVQWDCEDILVFSVIILPRYPDITNTTQYVTSTNHELGTE